MKLVSPLLSTVALAGLIILPLKLNAQAPAATVLSPPVIERNTQGTVTMTCASPGAVIRYSLDGSDPGEKTGPYLAPVVLPAGGTVKARAFSEDRKQKSELAEAKMEAVPGTAPLPATLVPCTQDRDWPIYDWAKLARLHR